MMKVTAPDKIKKPWNKWMATLKSDREAAFERLYEAAFPQVARYIQQRGGTLEDAKDTFHEAMILFYEKTVSGTFPEKASPTAYLFGIARNLWRRHFRNKDNALSLDNLHLADSSTEPSPATSRFHRLFDYLERAGRKCMDLLQAFYYHRFNMQEIAEEFGYSSPRSATVQKYKCLEKVREQAQLEQTII
jgi:RNA polymerase sigma factor (sigma-70 family)